ncbi:MAG: SH3 domain-containing protein [Chloroflexi bacterium]|nr:SH3 domain-containing protein [Chloroflexota bacterium]
MRRVWIVIGSLLVLLLLTGSTLADPPQQAGGVSARATQNLNLRAGPGTHWKLMGTVDAGATVRLDGRDGSATWVRGLAPSGEVWWMFAAYLDISPEQVAALPVVGVDTPSQLTGPAPAQPSNAPAAPAASSGPGITARTSAAVNVRSGPSSAADRIGRLAYQAEVRVQGRNAAGDWVRAALPDGGTGWISAAYLSLTVDQVAGLPVVEGGAAAPAAAAASNANAPIVNTAPVSGFGVGGHVSSFGSAAINAMNRAGMTWVKKQYRWGGSEGSITGMISDAHSKGFRILIGIVGSAGSVNDPAYIERYASFVAGAAAAGADAIEIWNEQNIDREWASGSIDPAKYTELLRQSYNAIKAANPNTLVVSGAPAPTGFFGGCSPAGCDDAPFLAGMAAAGAANYMDCVGVHYNEGIVPPGQTSGDPRGNGGHYTRYFLGMVNTYYNAFGGAKPLCFTELGYLSPEGYGSLPDQFAWAANVSVAQQAAWLAEAVSLARSSGKVRLLIVWNVDFTNFGSDPMAGYAMIRADGSCPACDALAGAR